MKNYIQKVSKREQGSQQRVSETLDQKWIQKG